VTRRFIFLEEGDIAEVTRRSVTVFDTKGEQVKRQEIESNLQYDAGDKGAYRHYMQKEIYEQPNAIKNTLTGRISHGEVDLSELGANANELLGKVEHIQIVACGTSYNSGMVSRYWFESLAGVPCDVEIASEFRYRKSAVRRNSLMITFLSPVKRQIPWQRCVFLKSWVTWALWPSVTFQALRWCVSPIWR
jgi:glucosamine--fructose-6-phosphate aminotransferase (isomerizing)